MVQQPPLPFAALEETHNLEVVSSSIFATQKHNLLYQGGGGATVAAGGAQHQQSSLGAGDGGTGGGGSSSSFANKTKNHISHDLLSAAPGPEDIRNNADTSSKFDYDVCGQQEQQQDLHQPLLHDDHEKHQRPPELRNTNSCESLQDFRRAASGQDSSSAVLSSPNGAFASGGQLLWAPRPGTLLGGGGASNASSASDLNTSTSSINFRSHLMLSHQSSPMEDDRGGHQGTSSLSSTNFRGGGGTTGDQTDFKTEDQRSLGPSSLMLHPPVSSIPNPTTNPTTNNLSISTGAAPHSHSSTSHNIADPSSTSLLRHTGGGATSTTNSTKRPTNPSDNIISTPSTSNIGGPTSAAASTLTPTNTTTTGTGVNMGGGGVLSSTEIVKASGGLLQQQHHWTTELQHGSPPVSALFPLAREFLSPGSGSLSPVVFPHPLSGTQNPHSLLTRLMEHVSERGPRLHKAPGKGALNMPATGENGNTNTSGTGAQQRGGNLALAKPDGDKSMAPTRIIATSERLQFREDNLFGPSSFQLWKQARQLTNSESDSGYEAGYETDADESEFSEYEGYHFMQGVTAAPTSSSSSASSHLPPHITSGRPHRSRKRKQIDALVNLTMRMSLDTHHEVEDETENPRTKCQRSSSSNVDEQLITATSFPSQSQQQPSSQHQERAQSVSSPLFSGFGVDKGFYDTGTATAGPQVHEDQGKYIHGFPSSTTTNATTTSSSRGRSSLLPFDTTNAGSEQVLDPGLDSNNGTEQVEQDLGSTSTKSGGNEQQAQAVDIGMEIHHENPVGEDDRVSGRREQDLKMDVVDVED
ncbi:unnamed protein product [Amoebophrya sp. A25]|nr:unnamed protein product [Amoebophrya sp. A25]|eukprot:GSA25T00007230001.1